jgi:hypothetical protein
MSGTFLSDEGDGYASFHDILSLRIVPMYRPIDSYGHIDCHFSSRKRS